MRALVAVVASIAVLATAACHDTAQPPVAAKPGVADSADQVFFGMQFFLTTNGIKRGDLTADTDGMLYIPILPEEPISILL